MAFCKTLKNHVAVNISAARLANHNRHQYHHPSFPRLSTWRQSSTVWLCSMDTLIMCPTHVSETRVRHACHIYF